MALHPLAPEVLGDPMLDHDHVELFCRVLAFSGTSGRSAIDALAALRAEAGAHFGREDADLQRLGANNAACHLDEHAAVLASLEEVEAILRDRATTRDVAKRLVTSLSDELLRWLPAHVREMDAGLASVRSQSRFGGVPLRLARPSSGIVRTL